MRIILAVILAVLSSASSAFAATNIRPIESLNELPSRWSGVAGDLTTKVEATLVIDRIKSATREERSDGSYFAKYDVDAKLTIGRRSVEINQLNMSRLTTNGTEIVIVLFSNDELVKTIWGRVTYDEATDSFQFADVVRDGMRRFVLTGSMRHR